RVHGAEHPVPGRADRLEDRAVEDVRAYRDLRVEPEEQDQDRGHQRAAAHARHPDEDADEQACERELPGHGRPICPGIGQETNGRPVRRQPSLYASQPVQKPVIAARRARAATSSASATPAAVQPSANASVDEPSTTAPTMFAARGGRLSSSGPSPKRGCTSSKYATQGRQKRRPKTSPTTSCSASRATIQCQPVATATSEKMPIVAWLKRGARESTTVVSRYGSASTRRYARYASIRTSATSGRENSTGGSSPAASSSRTFVPLRKTWSSAGCGHVFELAIDPHVLHQNECSKNIGSMSSSCATNSSKISCASYVP